MYKVAISDYVSKYWEIFSSFAATLSPSIGRGGALSPAEVIGFPRAVWNKVLR